MPASSKAPQKRKHVTTACLLCRRSKVKCDGLTPSCSNCITKGCQCRYQMADDRRKLSLRVAVELLCRRARQLCQFIEEKGMAIPPMPGDEEAMLQRVLTTVGVPHDKLTSTQHSSSSKTKADSNVTSTTQETSTNAIADFDFDEISRSTTNGDLQTMSDPARAPPPMPDLTDQNWEAINTQTQNCGPSYPPQRNTAAQSRHRSVSSISASLDRAAIDKTSPPDDDIGDNESVEELVDLLSDRMGSLQIGADGQIRYYGPTSNFGLLNMSSTDPLHIHRSVRNDGQEYLDRLEVGAEVPPELEEHLVNLYFTWQDASFHIVDRDVYEAGKHKWHQDMIDTPYYSEALRNAICSLGAAFEAKHHPNFVTFPKSLGDFFADRAKTLLDIEMDAPSVATAQAMVVTSCHDMGCTRDARAWLYSGMAIRLAFDLGLHKDMTPYVEKGVITHSEADLRRTIFWGAYLVDQAWAFYLGRQFKIGMEDVSCAKPSGDLNVSGFTQWTPYSSPKPPQTQSPTSGYVKEVSRQRVLLCEIMAPLGHNLYSGSGVVPATMQQINAATVEQLSKWKKDLPVPLQVDLDNRSARYLPHVLLMHMHYYQSVIYAHRPWMSRTYLQPSPPQGPGSEHARQVCVDAATSIAKLLEGYESRYTFRCMNTQGPMITLSAALLLVFADVTRYGHSQGLDIARHLSVCFRALEEFGRSWESAKRARDLLLKLQRQWDLKARTRRNVRRGTGLTKTISNTSASRRRPLTATGFDSGQHDHSSPQPHQQYSLPSSEQQQQGPSQGGDDGVGPDFDMDFDWIMEANEQAVSGKWAPVQSSVSIPFDFMGFLGDPRLS